MYVKNSIFCTKFLVLLIFTWAPRTSTPQSSACCIMWRVFWHFLAQQQYWLRHLSQNYSTNRRRTCQRGRIIVAATTSDQSQWVWHWRLIFNTLARRLRCVCVWVWRWRVKLCEYFSHFFWFYFQICVFNLRSLRLANVCQTDLPFRHIRHQHKQTFQSTSIIRVDVNVKRVTSFKSLVR